MVSWELAEGDVIVPGRTAVERLGGGTRYEVYLAWDERLRALVAVKMLRPSMLDEPSAVRGLRAESALLRRLAHPALLRAFDHALEGDRPHIALELVHGPRLSTLLRRYGTDAEQLLPLALNLCAVLHYLGEEGVVHLDVKPSNVVMAGEPKLIDLSVAREIGEARSLRSPAGTDAYMAPEQCDPARFGEIGPATDVFGLGATLHEALAGAPPFARSEAEERFPQLRRPAPPLPADAPPALADAVRACLAPDPRDRPAAADLGDALEPAVAALPAPKLGRFRPAPRHRLPGT